MFQVTQSTLLRSSKQMDCSNPERKITRLKFGKLLKGVWEKAATNKNATFPFEVTGNVRNPEIVFSMSSNHTEERPGTQETSERRPSIDHALTVPSTSVSLLKFRVRLFQSLQAFS